MRAVTVVSPARRWQAGLLAESLAEHQPDLALDVTVMPAEGDMAALCGAKPAALRAALDGGGPALYLDADVLVLGDLGPLLDAVAAHDVLLVPHLVAPLTGPGRAARDLAILRSGTFNAGVLGVGPGGRAFLDWWAAAMARACGPAVEDGVFFDQRWLDLVPALFDRVGILRDARFDVGHWNLPERAGEDVRLLHLSGFDPERPDRVSRHDDRLTLADVGPLAGAFRRYAAAAP